MVDSDVPPAYDSTGASSSRSDKKNASQAAKPLASSSSRSHLKAKDVGVRSYEKYMGKIGIGSPKVLQKVKTGVQKILTDLLLKQNNIDTETEGFGILEDCSKICATHKVDLGGMLREKSIDGHTALYWAIVKRRKVLPLPDTELQKRVGQSWQAEEALPRLIQELLSFMKPLTPDATADARLACLHAGDTWLFQCIRSYSAPTATDLRLLEGQVADILHFSQFSADTNMPFVVGFQLKQFQKRLKMSKFIILEFIAFGRMFYMKFYVTAAGEGEDAGRWHVYVTLNDDSAPIFVNATLIIDYFEDPSKPYEYTIAGLIRRHTSNVISGLGMLAKFPDPFMHPQSPYIDSEGTLCGSLSISERRVDS
ncbi:hypothetical protein MIND_00959300 [Mycena indigotica]|uniref:Uncharacterized protein n=1 Tax=Mycena indigotica TaxID=2126181 RepID=A0A8H6SCZ3_9AGAR|nr:uncharacterized protein MIND_00959300 [Mycena indigotica]KAF7297261.1 hypothetical protein MIND_00959300 [Mycena indigotica]